MSDSATRKEIEYYQEISMRLVDIFKANLPKDQSIIISSLIGDIHSGLNTLIANGYDVGDKLREYSKEIYHLRLDITLLLENKRNGKFDLVIFEIKKVKSLGLSEFSQLIGYCLVSKIKFGILINIDNGLSSDFSSILESDRDITEIKRIIDNKIFEHDFGVIFYNSSTKQFEYSNLGKVKTIPNLVNHLLQNIR